MNILKRLEACAIAKASAAVEARHVSKVAFPSADVLLLTKICLGDVSQRKDRSAKPLHAYLSIKLLGEPVAKLVRLQPTQLGPRQ